MFTSKQWLKSVSGIINCINIWRMFHFLFNTHFQYDDNFSYHQEIKLGLYTCMERFIVNQVERNKGNIQIDAFQKKEGLFGFQEKEKQLAKHVLLVN